MTITWSFNSYKGGTGKTNTSLNTAVQLAREGNNVCLLDFDFLGPALFAIFGTRKGSYLNQAFYEEVEIEDVFERTIKCNGCGSETPEKFDVCMFCGNELKK